MCRSQILLRHMYLSYYLITTLRLLITYMPLFRLFLTSLYSPSATIRPCRSYTFTWLLSLCSMSVMPVGVPSSLIIQLLNEPGRPENPDITRPSPLQIAVPVSLFESQSAASVSPLDFSQSIRVTFSVLLAG